jgi:hypothetical protein
MVDVVRLMRLWAPGIASPGELAARKPLTGLAQCAQRRIVGGLHWLTPYGFPLI